MDKKKGTLDNNTTKILLLDSARVQLSVSYLRTGLVFTRIPTKNRAT